MILVPTRFRFNTKCLQWWCLVAFSVAILLPVSSSAAMKQTQDMTQNSPSSSISSSFTSSGRVGNIVNTESYHDQGVPNDVELRHLFERSESPPTSQTKRMSSSSSRLFHIQSPSLLGKHGERRMIAESISCPNPEWSQLGMTISGKATNDHFGNVVRMSADGQVIITCAAQQAFGQGYARVYRRDDSDPLGWVQVGEELNGSVFSSSIAWGAQWGQSCAISADGDVIAISSKALRLVRIYRRDPYAVSGLGWTQVGENIQSSVPNDEFGSFIDMSGNGSVVLISAGEYNKIFQSNADDPIGWSQVGSAIPIQYARSKLSYNGEIVVVSNFISDVVQIFQQNDSVPLGWEQLGEDLEGDEEGDHFGVEMGLSDNGEVLAISAYRANANRGHVKVFKKNSTTQQYEQIGGDIDGDVDKEFFGTSIALSGNSDILSIVQNINTAGSWTGYSYLYKMDPLSGLWAKITTDIQYECHVSSTALSYNGEVLAAGCLSGGTPANQDVGEVNILEVCHEVSIPSMIPSSTPSMAASSCSDDTSWRYAGNNKKHCGWVYMSPSRHCSKRSAEGVRASEACPIACGNLRTKSCDIPNCSDDSWFFWWPKRGGKWKVCYDYLHQHGRGRCRSLGVTALSNDPKFFAYEYCSRCNACVP